jgi:hypothetical protein
MATTKKSHTPKKSSAATSSKKRGSKKAPRLTWRFYVVTIGIFLVAVTTVVVIGFFAHKVVSANVAQQRYDRITAIYDSFELGNDYLPQLLDVFGDKRVYGWDKSRTFSSTVGYVHGDTVSNTVADVDGKIKAAGFTFFDEPYPGSRAVQYHYKSKDGEYVRLTVESKPYRDAWQNSQAMGKDTPSNLDKMNTNAGPSVVTIKVNLDDNNE